MITEQTLVNIEAVLNKYNRQEKTAENNERFAHFAEDTIPGLILHIRRFWADSSEPERKAGKYDLSNRANSNC